MATIVDSPEQHTPATRILALDGVRGVAVLLVLVFHFSAHPVRDLGQAGGLYLHWLRFTSIGWIGVDLFFVLSGFLITSILYDAKGPALAFFKNFYARRVLRIFPVYYALLVFLLLVLPLVIPGEEAASDKIRANQIYYWLYISNIKGFLSPGFMSGAGQFVNHLWSLAVEEQFYLVWPLIVFLFGRHSLIVITGVLFLSAIGLRIALIENGELAGQVHGLPLARMDVLGVGAGIALLVRGQRGRAFLNAIAWPAVGAALLALVALSIHVGGVLRLWDPIVVKVGLSFIAVLFGGVVAAVVLAPPASALSRILSLRPLTILGKYSYAIYVIHVPVIQVLVRHTDIASNTASVTGSQLVGMFAVALVATAITFFLAALSWRLIETPFLNLRSRFSSKPARMSWSS